MHLWLVALRQRTQPQTIFGEFHLFTCRIQTNDNLDVINWGWAFTVCATASRQILYVLACKIAYIFATEKKGLLGPCTFFFVTFNLGGFYNRWRHLSLCDAIHSVLVAEKQWVLQGRGSWILLHYCHRRYQELKPSPFACEQGKLPLPYTTGPPCYVFSIMGNKFVDFFMCLLCQGTEILMYYCTAFKDSKPYIK